MTQERLDEFEKLLQDGLVKLCSSENLMAPYVMVCPDVTDKWDNDYIKGYVEDAVANFNSYPEAALGFAAYLGMAVAHNWDKCWLKYSGATYQSYYGSRGWDDMDDHIVADVLHLKADAAEKIKNVLDSCALATLGLIRHEGIEAQTSDGFYVLVRSYGVMFRIGMSIELTRKGYWMETREAGKQ